MSEHPYPDRDFLTLGIGANIELSGPDFPTRYALNKNTLCIPLPKTRYIYPRLKTYSLAPIGWNVSFDRRTPIVVEI